MSNSIQDQLLALGLAKKKQRSKAKIARKPSARRHESGAANNKESGELSLEKAFALRKQHEKRQAGEARRKKIEDDRRRKQINGAIREIVKANRLNSDDAVIARNFMFRGRIRKVHVTQEQLRALNAGELGIAYLSGGYHLLSKEHTDAVRLLSADHVADLSSGSDDDGDHPVPEDLTW